MGLSTPNSGPPRDRRFSPPVALWCPYCHQSFVGTVDRVTGRFVHGSCPVGRLDLAQIRRLAADQWFWARFLDRLGIALPPGAAHRLDGRQPGRRAGQGSKAST
jgi:hypothetical protein